MAAWALLRGGIDNIFRGVTFLDQTKSAVQRLSAPLSFPPRHCREMNGGSLPVSGLLPHCGHLVGVEGPTHDLPAAVSRKRLDRTCFAMRVRLPHRRHGRTEACDNHVNVDAAPRGRLELMQFPRSVTAPTALLRILLGLAAGVQLVMTALVAGIRSKTWMAGTSPRVSGTVCVSFMPPSS